MSRKKQSKVSELSASRVRVKRTRSSASKKKKANVSAVPRVMLPVLGFSDAEVQLGRAIEKLRQSSTFSVDADRKVGEFWDALWPAAPFEETMTLRQATESNIANLLRKRSFTGQKVTAFIYALLRAAGNEPTIQVGVIANSEDRSPVKVSLVKEDSKTIRESDNKLVPAKSYSSGWITEELVTNMLSDGVSDLHIAALRYLEFQSEVARSSRKGLAVLLSAIPLLMSPVEYLELWQSSSTAFSSKCGCATKVVQSAGGRLTTHAESVACDLLQAWRTSLTGPGVQEDLLFTPYLDPSLDLLLQRSIGRVLLISIGAKPTVIRGCTLKGAWSINEMAADMVFEAMAMTLEEGGASDVLLIERIRTFFPLLGVEQVLSFYQNCKRPPPGKE